MAADKPVWKDLEGYQEYDAPEMTRSMSPGPRPARSRPRLRESARASAPVPQSVAVEVGSFVRVLECEETAVRQERGLEEARSHRG